MGSYLCSYISMTQKLLYLNYKLKLYFLLFKCFTLATFLNFSFDFYFFVLMKPITTVSKHEIVVNNVIFFPKIFILNF